MYRTSYLLPALLHEPVNVERVLGGVRIAPLNFLAILLMRLVQNSLSHLPHRSGPGQYSIRGFQLSGDYVATFLCLHAVT